MPAIGNGMAIMYLSAPITERLERGTGPVIRIHPVCAAENIEARRGNSIRRKEASDGPGRRASDWLTDRTLGRSPFPGEHCRCGRGRMRE